MAGSGSGVDCDDGDDDINRPVLPRDGHCGTFIVEMPLACSASTDANTSGCGGTSSSTRNNDSASNSGGNNNNAGTVSDVSDVNIHLHEPNAPHIHHNDHQKNIDAEKEASLLLLRKLCLSPSFTTNQQDGDPFYLHVELSDDEEEDEEDDEIQEIEEDENEGNGSVTVDLESGCSNMSTTETDDGHLNSNGGNGNGSSGGARNVGSGSSGGSGNEDDDDVLFQQLRVVHRKNQQQLKKQRKQALKQQQRAIKAYDHLDDAIAVR